MAMIVLKCPNCNGNVQFDDKLETGFCMYCGSKIVNEKAIATKIKVDHEGEIKGLLELAKIAYQKEEYDKAESYADDVVKIDSRVADAWIIKSALPSNESNREAFLLKAKSPEAKSYGIFLETDCEQGFSIEFQFDKLKTHSYEVFFTIDGTRRLPYAPNSKQLIRLKEGTHEFCLNISKQNNHGSITGSAKPIQFNVDGDCKYRVKDGFSNIKLIKL